MTSFIAHFFAIADQCAQLFIAWVVVSLIWLWFTLFVANFYPLVDGGLKKIWQIIRWEVTPQDKETSGSVTPSSDSPSGGVVTEQVKLDEKHEHA